MGQSEEDIIALQQSNCKISSQLLRHSEAEDGLTSPLLPVQSAPEPVAAGVPRSVCRQARILSLEAQKRNGTMEDRLSPTISQQCKRLFSDGEMVEQHKVWQLGGKVR
jgi:hypothetical protein